MNSAESPGDVWVKGELYEAFIGRWSRLAAAEFLDWLTLSKDGQWLDVGCGAGALSEAILLRCEPRQIKGVDSSEGYIEFLRKKIQDPHAVFEVGDARALPAEAGTFDGAVSGLVLNFVPQPGRMIAEMKRVVRKGGIVALYVWDYAGKMQLLRHFWNSAASLDPAAYALDEGRRFPICDPGKLKEQFIEAGLQHVETRAIDIPTDFKNFDDYWAPFLGGQGPASGYTMSLSEEKRARLREKIRGSLPVAVDGSISLVARVWAVRGMK